MNSNIGIKKKPGPKPSGIKKVAICRSVPDNPELIARIDELIIKNAKKFLGLPETEEPLGRGFIPETKPPKPLAFDVEAKLRKDVKALMEDIGRVEEEKSSLLIQIRGLRDSVTNEREAYWKDRCLKAELRVKQLEE